MLRRTGQALFVQLSDNGGLLIAPDLPRLVGVLVLGKGVEARPFIPLLGSFKLDRWALVLRTVIVMAMVYGQVHASYKRWNDMYSGPPAPVSGRWDLVSMQVDKKEPGKDDSVRWSSLDFSNRKYMRLAGPKPPTVVHLITWDTQREKPHAHEGPYTVVVGEIKLRTASAGQARTQRFNGRQGDQRR